MKYPHVREKQTAVELKIHQVWQKVKGISIYIDINTQICTHALKFIADITGIPLLIFSWKCLFTLMELLCSKFLNWMLLVEQEAIFIYSVFAVIPRKEGIRVRCLILISFKRLVNLHSLEVLRFKSWQDFTDFNQAGISLLYYLRQQHNTDEV